MPKKRSKQKDNVRYAPSSMITDSGRLRRIFFPSLPPIGTCLLISNHPFEIVGHDEFILPDETVIPAIIWQGKCLICEENYQVKCGLKGVPSVRCHDHRQRRSSPEDVRTKIDYAKNEIDQQIRESKMFKLSKKNDFLSAYSVLIKAAEEMEEEGLIMRIETKERVYIST